VTCRIRKTFVFVAMCVLILTPFSAVRATSVNRMSLCNIDGSPGKTVWTQITLTGTETGTRTGYWDVIYRKTEGDSEMMDISKWITVEPKNFTISENETKSFNVKIEVPAGTTMGLWGATTNKAGESGHSVERRTYIVFKDTIEGGNIYSGLLIPISVQVVGKANPLSGILSFLKANLLVIVLVAIILILGVTLVTKIRQPKRM
jgi:hypothetical protein